MNEHEFEMIATPEVIATLSLMTVEDARRLVRSAKDNMVPKGEIVRLSRLGLSIEDIDWLLTNTPTEIHRVSEFFVRPETLLIDHLAIVRSLHGRGIRWLMAIFTDWTRRVAQQLSNEAAKKKHVDDNVIKQVSR